MNFINLREILKTPWKFWNRLNSLMCYPAARLIFALNSIKWGKGWKLYGLPVIQKHRQSIIEINDFLQLRSTLRSNPLGPNHAVILSTWNEGAFLKIGKHFGMTGGIICAASQIEIGDYVTIGANTSILDTDFHPLDRQLRKNHPADANSLPIYIEDDVFVGMNCLILKGVRLGKGCVIGAGSVVTRDIPSGMIAAGNPASVIGMVGRVKEN